MGETATHLNSTIGERIARFRTHLGMTQQELADAVDGTKRGLQGNEEGKALPNSKMLLGLVDLGLNLNWLMTGDGSMVDAVKEVPNQANNADRFFENDLATAIAAIDDVAQHITPSMKAAIMLLACDVAAGRANESQGIKWLINKLINLVKDMVQLDPIEAQLLRDYRAATITRKQAIVEFIKPSNNSS